VIFYDTLNISRAKSIRRALMTTSRSEIQIEADLRAILLPKLEETNQDSLVNEIKSNSSFLIASYLNDVRYDELFMKFYISLNNEEKIIFFDKMISLCVKEKNTNLLMLFKKLELNSSSSIFQDCIGRLSSSSKLQLEQLLAIEKIESETLKAVVQEFIIFGALTKDGALLSLAQTENRKQAENPNETPFFLHQPTILNPNEFKTYLEIIKNSSLRPLRKDFTFAAAHWLTGTIQIDKDENVSILFVDSAGKNLKSNTEYFKQIKDIFPTAKIYHNFARRQIMPVGCGMFALEDLRKLNKIDQYLGKNLFSYLSEQKTSGEVISLDSGQEVTVNLCQLPLALERIMQSRSLYETVIPGRSEEEKKLPINKKGLTAEDSLKIDFKEREVTKDNKTEMKYQNLRIYQVLEKLFNYNVDFVLKNDEEFILKKMNSFSLKGFKKNFVENKQSFLENKQNKPDLLSNSLYKTSSTPERRDESNSLSQTSTTPTIRSKGGS